MLVLMDMEWIENRAHYFCPTQISAMRVDGRWNCVDRFDALIKPFDASCHQWKHVAYSGAEPEAFLAAKAGPRVFWNLSRWLREEDVLCWWGEQPALVFKSIVGKLQHRDVTHPMRIIYPAWRANTADSHLMTGSPYRLARDRGVRVPKVEHASANDVEAVRALLHSAFIPPAAVENSRINYAAKAMTQTEFRKDRARKSAHVIDLTQYQFFYNASQELLHTAGCPEMGSETELQGFATFKSCIYKGMTPCSCCSEEYWRESWRLSQETIRKCHYNYIYMQGEKRFHLMNCIHVKQIPTRKLRGGIYYWRCLENGLTPCGECNPTKEQQVYPPSNYPRGFPKEDDQEREGFPKKDDQKREDNPWLATRRLTRVEVTALQRHKVAQKERDALAQEKQLKTQAERRDEHILTQSGYAFWAAVGYRTFHLRNCAKLDRISGLRGYARYQDAIRAGLTPCKQCKPSEKNDIRVSVPIYQRNRQGESVETLDALCDAQGYQHRVEAHDYFIETEVGKWRLDTRTHPVDVYHINLAMTPNCTRYHKQPRLFLSLSDTFEYIKRHDTSLMEKIKPNDL